MRNKNILFVGKVFHHFPRLPSTNLYASELLSKSKPIEGTVISTAHQTAGRGQIGSSWETEAGQNITLSVILYPSFLEPRRQFALNQATALSVRDVITRYTEKAVKVKWPNDIYLERGKLAGILIQTSLSGNRFQNCIIGTGINVNQEIFPSNLPNPTSLFLETGRKYDTGSLIEEYCQALERRYLQLRSGRLSSLQEEYHNHLFGMGQELWFERPGGERFRGMIRGVNPIGQLLIRHGNSEEAFHLKEVATVGTPKP